MGSRLSAGGFLFMMNSMFKKMLVFALAFSLGSLLCSSLIIGFLLEKKIYDRTQDTLVIKATDLHEEVELFLNGDISKETLKQTILLLQERDHIQVSIMTAERQALFVEKNAAVQKWIGDVLDQKSNFAEVTFYKNNEINMFIVGVPILIENENKGAIFLYTPMKEAEGLVQDINQMIGLAVVLLLLPIIFISFLLSKKITAPIVSMSETVRSISKGNFDKKVQLKGKDELTSLGEAINSMADRLAIIEQSRKRFIGEISHELRTPLTTIRSTLQGIADEILSVEEEEELIQISINEIKRISQLIDDLADLSALEEKAVILYKQKTSITELVEACILQLSLQAKQKEIVIEKEVEAAILARVDVDRLKQVCINLLENAIKHSRIGAIVKINLKTENSFIVINFENSGDEIPSHILPFLFDRFYKTDQSRSQKGNGLGLTIAKKIVELHDGDINVESHEGKIRFIVKIPQNQ
jgi:signal transduction histidine kinase